MIIYQLKVNIKSSIAYNSKNTTETTTTTVDMYVIYS